MTGFLPLEVKHMFYLYAVRRILAVPSLEDVFLELEGERT